MLGFTCAGHGSGTKWCCATCIRVRRRPAPQLLSLFCSAGGIEDRCGEQEARCLPVILGIRSIVHFVILWNIVQVA